MTRIDYSLSDDATGGAAMTCSNTPPQRDALMKLGISRLSKGGYIEWKFFIGKHAEGDLVRFLSNYPNNYPNITMDAEGRLHYEEQSTEPIPLNQWVFVRLDYTKGLYWLPVPEGTA